MHLSALYIYPVKSLRGFSVTAAEVDSLGVAGDRRFLVVDENNRFLTQRALPRMAQIATGLGPASLKLTAAGHGGVSVGRAPEPGAPVRSVTIWKSENLLAEDCGDAPAVWLSDFLGVKCRLVRVGPKFLRPIVKANAGPGDVVSFPDAYPFMAVGESSLADLNDRLVEKGEEPVPMNRFRPSFVITGGPAFAEDTWTRVRIGDVVFRAGGPCLRCIVTTTDQFSGERGKEPLRTLATYRRSAADPGDVKFGQNLIHETKSGLLRVGDAVQVLG